MNNYPTPLSIPVVHWISSGLLSEECQVTEALQADFVIKWYGSMAEFLSGETMERSDCVVVCRDCFDIEVAEFFEQVYLGNKCAKVILYVASLEIPDAVRAIQLGFSDVIRMPCHAENLRHSLQHAIESDPISRSKFRVDIPNDILSLLNTEEARIFRFMVQGAANKQIGAELGLSIRTIHYRKKKIFEKLRINSRSEAIEMLRTYRSEDGVIGRFSPTPANNLQVQQFQCDRKA